MPGLTLRPIARRRALSLLSMPAASRRTHACLRVRRTAAASGNAMTLRRAFRPTARLMFARPGPATPISMRHSTATRGRVTSAGHDTAPSCSPDGQVLFEATDRGHAQLVDERRRIGPAAIELWRSAHSYLHGAKDGERSHSTRPATAASRLIAPPDRRADLKTDPGRRASWAASGAIVLFQRGDADGETGITCSVEEATASDRPRQDGSDPNGRREQSDAPTILNGWSGPHERRRLSSGAAASLPVRSRRLRWTWCEIGERHGVFAAIRMDRRAGQATLAAQARGSFPHPGFGEDRGHADERRREICARDRRAASQCNARCLGCGRSERSDEA